MIRRTNMLVFFALTLATIAGVLWLVWPNPDAPPYPRLPQDPTASDCVKTLHVNKINK